MIEDDRFSLPLLLFSGPDPPTTVSVAGGPAAKTLPVPETLSEGAGALAGVATSATTVAACARCDDVNEGNVPVRKGGRAPKSSEDDVEKDPPERRMNGTRYCALEMEARCTSSTSSLRPLWPLPLLSSVDLETAST